MDLFPPDKAVWNFPHKITESELLFVCFVSGVLREMLNLLRVTLSKFNFSLRNPRIKQTNKSSDSVILCRKFQTALQLWNLDYIRLPLYEVKQHISRGRGRPKKQCHALERLTRQQPDIRPFQWGIISLCISRGCQTAVRQSSRSKKKADILGSRLHFM